MGRAMFRHEVPVDDQAHHFELTSNPVQVAVKPTSDWLGTPDQDAVVEFWAEHAEGAPTVRRAFRVYGTGHGLPDDARWVGTCPRTPEGLVWHLYELEPGARA